METIEKSDSGNIDVEDKKLKSNGDEEDNLLQINKRGDVMMHVKQEENGIKQPPSMEAQIMSARAKIGEVREENERLKQLLCKIVEDYECLRKHFCEVAQEEEEEEAKKSTKITPTHQENEESELVSLSLGRSSIEPKKEEKKSSNNSNDEKLNVSKGLPLGLDCKFEPDSTVTKKKYSSEYSFNEEAKEEEPTETWPPSKVLKTSISPEDEILRQIQIKKTRVSVRSRCDTPTMNDGCQWRKYGQKIAKGNPCPRAYYRCTISPNCPVRKKVQRCAEDMTILMTTYEGTHNHPLPLAATAMASTTCAAASMLQSPSLTSQPGLSSPMSANGFNFTLTQNSKPQPFYFPNSSVSNSNSLHPTVTLDLTAPSASSSHFNTFPSTPRYSPTCLNFSTYNKKHSMFLNNIGQPKSSSSSSCNQQALTDQTIAAAATKVITANPTFRSVMTAGITLFVGSGVKDNSVNVDYDQPSSGLNLKVGDQSLTFSSAKNDSGSPASCRDTNKG